MIDFGDQPDGRATRRLAIIQVENGVEPPTEAPLIGLDVLYQERAHTPNSANLEGREK